MKYLTREQLLLIHSLVIDETGGSHGVRDNEAVLTSEGAPKQNVFGKDLYPDVFHKAVAYVRNILSARPFKDGNRRTALAVAAVFLEHNEYRFLVKEHAAAKFFAHIQSEKIDTRAFASWFKKHTKKQ